MAQGTASRSSLDVELTKLATPRIFLVRMLVFLILCGLVGVVLYKQILVAFMANPGLNALICAVLLIGIILAFRQVIRLYPEVSWVNSFRIADPGLALDRRPVLLAPMAAILGGERTGRMSITQQTMRHLLDSIATRLDEARDISRYMTGLLVFLGLLGTFWGLLGTIAAVGQVIDGLEVGSGDFAGVFAELKRGLQAPLGGMGTAFSSSLFGLGGSLVLGFLDLQAGHAQNRFFNGLEEWLSGVTQLVDDLGVPPLATATLAEPALAEPALAEPTPSGEPDDATLRLLIETIRSERQLIEALLTRHAAPLAAEPDRPEA